MNFGCGNLVLSELSAALPTSPSPLLPVKMDIQGHKMFMLFMNTVDVYECLYNTIDVNQSLQQNIVHGQSSHKATMYVVKVTKGGQIAFAVSPMMNLQERPLSIATCSATFLQLFSILFWTSFIQLFCWVHVISPIPDDFGVQGRHGLRCPILWAMLHCCFWPQLQFQTHRFPNKSSVADLPGKNKAM